MSAKTMVRMVGMLAALPVLGAAAATTERWIGGDQSSVDSSLEVAECWDGGQPMANGLSSDYDFLIDQDGARATMKHANTGYSIGGGLTVGSETNSDVRVEFTSTRMVVTIDNVKYPDNSSPAALRVGGVFQALGERTVIRINRGFVLALRNNYDGKTNFAQIAPEVTFEGEGIINFGDGSRLVPSHDYGELWVLIGQENRNDVPYALAGDLSARRLEVYQGGTGGIGGRSFLDLAGHTVTVQELAFGTLDNRTGDANPGNQSSFGGINFNGGTVVLAGDLEFRGDPDGTSTYDGTHTPFVYDHCLTTSGQGGRLEIGGSLNVRSRSSEGWNLNDLTVVFTGDGTAVQTLEALQHDGGDTRDCVIDPYAFGELEVKAGAHVRLVDEYDNDRAAAGAEAVYVRRLVVEAGATLDLNGVNLYVLKPPTIAGEVINGAVTQLKVAGVFEEQEYVLGTPGAATTGTMGNWVGPMAFGDYDGDGRLELALVQQDEDSACADSCLYMLKYDGTTVRTAFEPVLDTALFQNQASQLRFSDLGDGKGTRLLYASSGYSDIRALNADASYEVLADRASYGNANFILYDLNGDGVREIVTGARDTSVANLKVISPQTKQPVWTRLLAADAGIVTRVGVADVLGDHRPEVLALTKATSDASAYDLGIFDAAGELQRTLKLDFVRNEAAGLITALDLTGDGRREIVIVETTCDNRLNTPYGNSQGGMFIVDSETGATLFSVYASECDWSISHAAAQFFDCDGDRIREILYGDKIYKGHSTAGEAEFTVVDTLPVPSGAYFCYTLVPALVDLTGDGVPEIVYGCSTAEFNDNRRARQIMAYDPVAKSVLPGFPRALFSTQPGADADQWCAGSQQHWYMASLLAADWDGDGRWEIVVGLGTNKAGQTTRASLNIIRTPYAVVLPPGRTERQMGAWSYGRDDAMTFAYPLKKIGFSLFIR
ncbi:MAG: hypothetical protein ACI4RD_05575 [Kiritimatiellia bacterium]